MVRSGSKGSVGFLKDKRRLNVAMTRARRHIAIICDADFLSKSHNTLRKLLEHFRKLGACMKCNK
jgi:superfamily I DNA and/or RNA helicase